MRLVMYGVLTLCLLVNASHAAKLRFEKILPPADAQACGGTYDSAQFRGRIFQQRGATLLFVSCRACAPNTLYTLWQLFATGIHPTSGLPVAALVAPEVEALLPDNDPHPPNGFWTNARGRGHTIVHLPFPVIGGAFRFESGEIFALNHAPMPILRVASHCVDGVGHGRTPGEPHEVWFDLLVNPFIW